MLRKCFLPAIGFVAVIGSTSAHAEVTQDAFLLRTTGDLIELCSAAPDDPLRTAALNFCEGFGVGAYRVLAEVQMARGARMFCPPSPMPTRDQAIASFVQWGKANPGQLSQPPQDGLAAFLSNQYPCHRGK